MIITKFKLLGADDKFRVVTYEGDNGNPFDFIKTTEYSDYKVVGYEVIDLGRVMFNKNPRVTIGKGNCLNDTSLYLGNTLPEITNKLEVAFGEENYEGMKFLMNRLVPIIEDLDDMVDELNNLKKSGK